MRITFVLPGAGQIPIGGVKVIYEYANSFARRGVDVSIVCPALLYKDTPFLEKPKKCLRYIQRTIDKSFIPKWFSLDPRVKLLWVYNLKENNIPDGDIVIATAWQTAEWVKDYPKSKGIKLYFIHDYEHFMTASDDIVKRISKTFDFFKYLIVTSPAGEEMLRSCNKQPSITIPNPIDFNTFYLERNIDDISRNNIIGIPVRLEPFKGLNDSINALERIKTLFPHIKVWGFGSRFAKQLPKWIDFYYKPSNDLLRKLYNNTAVFVVASHYEGWGLPGSEAMACGAALVSTDNVGVRAYATNGFNALLSPPKDIGKLANNITKLLSDNNLRIQIAKNGINSIKRFTLENSVNMFLNFIENILKNDLS